MGQAVTTAEARWRLARATGLVVALVLFVVMPDKVIALLGGVGRLLIGLFALKIAWDHGPEVKGLLRGVAAGRLSLEAAGFKLVPQEKQPQFEAMLRRMASDGDDVSDEASVSTGES
jgi:hypothetical protein